MGSRRKTWSEIRWSAEYRGRWVALDSCSYDAKTAQPNEGVLVDDDTDLVALCNRIQESGNRHCAILYCDASEAEPPSTPRPHRFIAPAPGGRPYTH